MIRLDVTSTESMMTHDDTLLRERIAALSDGELPLGEARAVEEHLRGCARCERELTLQRAISSALAQEPIGVASIGLRRRIERLGLASGRPETSSWRVWAVPWATAASLAFAVLGAAALVSVEIGRAGALLAARNGSPIPIAAIPLLRDAVADCRRVTARNFPRKADVHAVGAGLRFSLQPLDPLNAELFSTWKTTLAGAPVAGLAYRWRGIVVVQYVVPVELMRRQPHVEELLRGATFFSGPEAGQGFVASVADGSGMLLLGDAPPEDLRRLIL